MDHRPTGLEVEEAFEDVALVEVEVGVDAGAVEAETVPMTIMVPVRPVEEVPI